MVILKLKEDIITVLMKAFSFNSFGAKFQTTFVVYFFIHNSGGVLWFHVGCPRVHPSVHPSVVRLSIRFSFPDDNLSKHQWIFTKLGMCIDIVQIWFWIANGQIFMLLSARDTTIFSFLDYNLSKQQGIFTKLAKCIDIKKEDLVWDC